MFIILAFTFIDISGTIYKDNWYPLEGSVNVTYRWMSHNASIFAYSPSVSMAKLNFIMYIYRNTRTLDIYVNSVFVGSYNVTENGSHITTPVITLRKGENKILLHSENGCMGVYKIENNNDARCLSFASRNMDVVIGVENLVREMKLEGENNWYGLETENNISFRWMSQDAAIQILNTGKSKEKAKMNLTVWSYFKPKTLQLYLNDNMIGSYGIGSDKKEGITTDLQLNPGWNIIKFSSKEDCVIPNKVENSTDTRCLSFAFTNMKVD